MRGAARPRAAAAPCSPCSTFNAVVFKSGAWLAACASVLAGARSVAAARRPRLPVLMMLSWPTGRCLVLPPSCFPSLLLSSRIILHLLPFHPFCLHLAAVWTAPNALGVWDMHGGAATFG